VKFLLIDAIIEQTDDRIVAVKNVSIAEEYLQDHFPTFPVLPGVLMLETLVQAARLLLAPRTGNPRMVLGQVKALRYGSFVRPGQALKVDVTILGESNGAFDCKGSGVVISPDSSQPNGELAQQAVTGRFTLRPINTGHAN
jgi:3-hydroxyacyl-[acyl-carrier-protein] dehydratase